METVKSKKIIDLFFSFFLFVFTFTVYVLTLSRSVYFDDSGKFAKITPI